MSGTTSEGSSARLVQLCAAYFSFYVITGVSVKYFTGPAEKGYPGLQDVEFLAYSTLGGSLVCLVVIFARGWNRTPEDAPRRDVAGASVPAAWTFILPSGLCTAVVIPTTTLMYMLPISVMVAMVIMRASVIVISRAVDEIQARQGILKRRPFWQEEVAVFFALAAAGTNLFLVSPGDFDFVENPLAMAILGAYILAYALRIYIMNYFKNAGMAGKADNRWFFAVEQIAASGVLVVATVAALVLAARDGAPEALGQFSAAFLSPGEHAPTAVLAGAGYGMVAFFSVFIFMFKGRTATFAGLVNRLTSLVAGTAATVVSYYAFGGKFPKPTDWASLGLILVAVGFLAAAEQRRARPA